MRAPAKVMAPVSGANTPAIKLNSVVLPAPFGPMTAKIARSGTAKLTSATARRPLKFLETLSSWSSATSGLRRFVAIEAQQACDRRPDPMWQDDHHQEQA